jgi:hypothetical protein
MRASWPIAGILLFGAVLAGCTTTWESMFPFVRKNQPPSRLVVSAGQPAPEIDGTDVDGASFKLSAYRGQVVMLDFWGNW